MILLRLWPTNMKLDGTPCLRQRSDIIRSMGIICLRRKTMVPCGIGVTVRGNCIEKRGSPKKGLFSRVYDYPKWQIHAKSRRKPHKMNSVFRPYNLLYDYFGDIDVCTESHCSWKLDLIWKKADLDGEEIRNQRRHQQDHHRKCLSHPLSQQQTGSVFHHFSTEFKRINLWKLWWNVHSRWEL